MSRNSSFWFALFEVSHLTVLKKIKAQKLEKNNAKTKQNGA